MERKQQLHDEDSLDPIELARKLKVCEAERAGLKRNYKELASDHEDQIHANMGLQHQLKALKKQMAKSRCREPKADEDYEFLCRENEELRRNLREQAVKLEACEKDDMAVQKEKERLREQAANIHAGEECLRRVNEELRKDMKEQDMKLWACERENMALQKEREQAANPQREKEEFLCRENEDLRKEIEELTERLHNTDELAGELETYQLKTIDQHQVILDTRRLMRKMGRCRNQLSTKLNAEKEEKQLLSQQNEDLRKGLKCQENLHSACELAMKNRISEMKLAHWQEVQNLEQEIATQEEEEKDASHLQKEALQQKLEEMVKKEQEQTMRLEAVEELVIRLKQQNEEKEKAEEALTSHNLSGEKDGKEVGEELHKKSRKPSLMRRFIKVFTPKRKEKEKKKDKMEAA